MQIKRYNTSDFTPEGSLARTTNFEELLALKDRFTAALLRNGKTEAEVLFLRIATLIHGKPSIGEGFEDAISDYFNDSKAENILVFVGNHINQWLKDNNLAL